MTVANKRKLSGSTDGRGIKITTTADAGDTIHTAVSGTVAGTFDEIWLWAQNSDTVSRILTIEFGSNTNPDDYIVITIPPTSGLTPVLPGLILQNAKVVKAFCDAANKVTLHGFVNTMAD